MTAPRDPGGEPTATQITQSLPTAAVRLSRFDCVVVAGPDARALLQGQLSADLDSLDPVRVLLASCNSSQGRVQAVLWLVERNDGIALILPGALRDTIITRLRKYVLRAKVQIDTPANRLHVGLLPLTTPPLEAASQGAWAHREIAGQSLLSIPGQDHALLLSSTPPPAADSTLEQRWQLMQIRAGLPHVYPATHEAFVAQMLNLDLLGGISFEKGCYTGQEIIARAHYRGAVKRRMLRFQAACTPPAPGTRVLSGDQHAGDVVDAAATELGCELLVVVSLTQLNSTLHLDAPSAPVLTRLPLPYVVPE